MSGRAPTEGLSPETLEALRVVFFQECEENLAELEGGLLALEGGAADWEIINTVFRAVHSIKGGAGAFGIERLVRFSHSFESSLSELRSGRLAAEPGTLQVFLRAADALADLVRAAGAGTSVPEERIQPIESRLAALVAPRTAEGGEDEFAALGFTPQPVAFEPLQPAEHTAPQRWRIRFRPHPQLYLNANDPLPLLRDLADLGEAEVALDETDLPPLQELEAEGAYLSWSIVLSATCDEQAIRDVFEFVEGDCDLDIELETAAPAPDLRLEGEPQAPPPSVAAAPSHTIRVDLERVDRLMDLVSELTINRAMLQQHMGDQGSSGVGLALDELDHITRDIQENVMAIRAQPVKTVFQRMSRLAREMETATGKQVRLVTEGDEVEVDRTVIERLTDPLTHMIRNAVDHGIESPAGRARAGKPARGCVRISAIHRAGRVVIEVSDDGAGVNRARVREIALSRGLITADAALGDEEIDNLIFAPGFSTAQSVSDLSGRGVGMDVVKRSVEELGGRLSVSSREGEGATFTLSLPLTLAVLDGMVVSAAGETFVTPLNALVETACIGADNVRRVGANMHLLNVRGAQVPLVDLAVRMGYRQTPELSHGVAIVAESEEGERIALRVDDVLGQRQVVIKSLETNYRRVAGVAAATIMGDGRVALILDVNALVAGQRGRRLHGEAA